MTILSQMALTTQIIGWMKRTSPGNRLARQKACLDKMAQKRKIRKMIEGYWYRVKEPDIIVCCDCGLVHKWEYKRKNATLYRKGYREQEHTAAIRKVMKPRR